MTDQATSGLRLRPYQESAIAAAIKPSPNWRRLLVLATGAGKTVIAAEIIRRLIQPGQRALFLAHRDEIIMQAKSEIEAYIPGVHVEIEKSENRATREAGIFDGERRHVVIGSVLTMQGKRLKSWARDAFPLVIIDEAHHGAAKSYRNIVEYFGCMSTERRVPLIGVTATPARSDKVGLGILFQEIAASHPLPALIEAGYLCDLHAILVETDTDLRRVRVRRGDFVQGELEDAVDTDERNELILAAHRKYASERPTIVFAAGVAHAKHLADMFRDSGIHAEAIYGDMDEDERRAALQRYHDGQTRVLTNYAVLTEGFNAPSTSCIILARPTKSSLVVAQAIGRGSRLAPGKEDCLVIDVRDVVGGKELFTAASLAGLPANFNAKGRNVYTAKERLDELEHLDPSLAREALDAEAVERSIVLAMERIRAKDIEMLRIERQRREKAAAWEAKRAEREARAKEMDGKIATLTGRNAARKYESPFMWYTTGNGIAVSPTNETTYSITPSQDGNSYNVTIRTHGEAPRVLGRYVDADSAMRAADKNITDIFSNTILIRRGAAWTQQPASEKQLASLMRCGERIEGRITKGEAAMRLNSAFAKKAYRTASPIAA
jgi:superfamily II DNA or RNA helicase